MQSFRMFIESYHGEHASPDPESGAPMHDLTANGIYPKDVYGPRGFDYSNHGDSKDRTSHYDAIEKKDKPYVRVRIFRAVPKDRKIKTINAGDWVTHNRDYAVEHGRSNLGVGKWKMLSKVVRARELFTDGNSIHEWGYHPQEADEGQRAHDKARNDKIRERMNSPEYKEKQARLNKILGRTE